MTKWHTMNVYFDVPQHCWPTQTCGEHFVQSNQAITYVDE